MEKTGIGTIIRPNQKKNSKKTAWGIQEIKKGEAFWGQVGENARGGKRFSDVVGQLRRGRGHHLVKGRDRKINNLTKEAVCRSGGEKAAIPFTCTTHGEELREGERMGLRKERVPWG